ncbi:zinc finger protein 480-like isoform X3 [Hylaeus volcanicus]|uniref:zinc finger protein 480-like isoform X3 n=1 Tax=Hylaeus volcanicus TaxID=313075 RepID=UPI0023B7C38D|nr:zinc finger protein 480-like isoform X3 [Hylaeus volcanicus]
MEPENSVILESCGEDSILIQSVKNIVTENTSVELESEEEFFVIADVQNKDETVIEASNEKSILTQSEERFSWSNLCRVCANINHHLIPIFEGEGLQHDLCSKIHKYLPIHVSETDTLPLQLCYHCAATLLAWHELLEGCLNAERRLLEIQNALQEKQSSEGLEVSIQDTSVYNVAESLPQQQETIKGEDYGESTVNNSDRSSSMRTPFKVFLDAQNIFRQPKRIKYQLQERKPTVSGDYDSVWISVMNSTLEQPVVIPELQNNDVDVKEEVSQPYKSHNLEKLKLDSETCKSGDPSNTENRDKKIKGKCKPCDRNNSKDSCEYAKHKCTVDVQETYQCIECGKCFKLKDSYLRHTRIHKDERPFTCHVCGKQFRDSGGLSRHLKDVHAKLKNFTCDICGKSFASKATREDHRRTHTGERPYICDSCGKTFKSKASLYIHSKLHTDEFPHPCSYCNKKFRRRQEMLAHITTHTGEKNYGCDVCLKRFRVKSELVRHKLIHSESKPFICVKCGLAFRQKRYLNNHIKSRHVETLRAC